MFKPVIISGMCKCGHSWEDHHLNIICNPEAIKEIEEKYPKHPWYIPGECEFYGCNEDGGKDAEGNYHCYGYVDDSA